MSSHRFMMCLWKGCIVMGVIYLLFLWDRNTTPAFVVSQIVLGVIGWLREVHLTQSEAG